VGRKDKMKYGYSEYFIEYVCDLFGWWVYRLIDNESTVAWHLHPPTNRYTANHTLLIFANAEELIEYAYEHKLDKKEGD
jgi:hypothetical protein